MNDIEKAIHDKKAEIKKANRELSELQDELAKSREPRWYRLDFIDGPHSYAYRYGITVQIESNHPIDKAELKSKIESLSDKPKEPEYVAHGYKVTRDKRCYVNWSEVPHGYDWVAVDGDGRVCAYNTKPDGEYCDCMWCVGAPGDFCIDIKRDAIIDSLPPWRDSLIHRPGVKE